MSLESQINLEPYVKELMRKRDSLDQKLSHLQKALCHDDLEIHKIKKQKLRLKDTLTKLYTNTFPDIIA